MGGQVVPLSRGIWEKGKGSMARVSRWEADLAGKCVRSSVGGRWVGCAFRGKEGWAEDYGGRA
jgi:hypothetical protein